MWVTERGNEVEEMVSGVNEEQDYENAAKNEKKEKKHEERNGNVMEMKD